MKQRDCARQIARQLGINIYFYPTTATLKMKVDDLTTVHRLPFEEIEDYIILLIDELRMITDIDFDYDMDDEWITLICL